MSDLKYKILFKDVCRGSTRVESPIGTCYIKHVSMFDEGTIDQNRQKYLEQAKQKELPTNEEALSLLYEEGYWTKQEENLISQEQLFVQKLSEQKKNTYLKSQIDSFNAQIEEAVERLNKLKNKRQSFLGNTCENYADQRVTEEFLKCTLFKDEKCVDRLFTDDEFDEINIKLLAEFIKIFNDQRSSLSDLNIQTLVLQDFFSYYMPFCEEPFQFFGRPIVDLSINQLKLLIYARYFKNIFSSNDTIPETFRRDPEKIIDYVTANEKAKKVISDAKDGQAQSIIGATSEDYKYINMQKGNTRAVSLAEEAKKKGGTLDMKDFMNLLGAE